MEIPNLEKLDVVLDEDAYYTFLIYAEMMKVEDMKDVEERIRLARELLKDNEPKKK